ncbi:DUF3564 domain-containing protein [Paraburkholderia sp. CNPSo 3274]|uniref:DUF3564 family protein n=1 Tax=Paraburkholderia sp. CNPSo 3274 TaxID=2940932 RepID=UPI0020B8CBCE|nr:DUF3564 family protein [Paraburkholderia sp. CNPSo 3274]MCP3710056.1 DUF3564 domain-containing protein [Paraburkholderia sp. CNPSo 3274]
MRVTVHLDSFDQLDPSACAIVWIDTEAKKWSREGHAGVSLSEWGQCRPSPGGTSLLACEDRREVCTLDGLNLGSSDGPFEGECGDVHWRARMSAGPLGARWHVQCVDESAREPEDGLFADEV